MKLTPAQQATVKADILANPDLNAHPNTLDGAFEIALMYGASASPDFWVYRTSVGKGEYVQTTSVDATNFSWTGNGFITRSAGEQAAWRELFNEQGLCNPSLPNVRQAFVDIFSGTGTAAANRVHLATISRRKTNRLERLLATGTGSTNSPGQLTFEGTTDYQEIYDARNLP